MRAEGIAIATELCEELLDGGRAGAALLHAQPVAGDAGDLRGAPDHGLSRRAYETAPCAPSPPPVTAPPRSPPTPPRSGSPPCTRASSLTEAARGASTPRCGWRCHRPRVHRRRPDLVGRAVAVAATTTTRDDPPGFEARHSLAIRCADLATAGALVVGARRAGRRPAGRRVCLPRGVATRRRPRTGPGRRRTPTPGGAVPSTSPRWPDAHAGRRAVGVGGRRAVGPTSRRVGDACAYRSSLDVVLRGRSAGDVVDHGDRHLARATSER